MRLFFLFQYLLFLSCFVFFTREAADYLCQSALEDVSYFTLLLRKILTLFNSSYYTVPYPCLLHEALEFPLMILIRIVFAYTCTLVVTLGVIFLDYHRSTGECGPSSRSARSEPNTTQYDPEWIILNRNVECYDKWIPDGDSCYLVSDVGVTWKEAEAHCHRYDSSLVEVPDTNKTDALKSLLESQYANRHTTVDKFFWIGGYGHDGDFIWKSTGSLITFQNWNKGNPLPVPGRHYEELCLEMVQSSDFKWNYALCNATNPFVCERKKN